MKTLLNFLLFLNMANAEVLIGKAVNESGEFVYSEEHQVERDSEGLTKHIETNYFDKDGKKFAKMTSDFENKVSAPNSKFEDYRFDRVFEGKFIKKNGKEIYQIVEFDSKKMIKSTDLDFKSDLVSGPGFDNYIKENLVKEKKSKSSVHFLVLPRHDYFRFEVIDKTSNSESNREYVIKPSLVLSLFVKEIKILYDNKTGFLKKYVGLSNLPSSQDKPQSVTIDYEVKNALKSEPL